MKAKLLQAAYLDPNRFVAKGYGKTMAVAGNYLANGKPDLKGMQMNRRVELKILEAGK
jgi:outer membrane protein OmpA-like peptidoglycan-associated protein